jgi:hypothetical protein
VSCIDTKKVVKRYSIPPAQKEKSTSQNCHHRKNIDHKINEKITGKILFIRNKHFTRMLAKIPYTIRMKTHDDERHILAEPSEEFQDSP